MPVACWWAARREEQAWDQTRALGRDDAAVSAMVERWTWAATHMPGETDRVRGAMMGWVRPPTPENPGGLLLPPADLDT